MATAGQVLNQVIGVAIAWGLAIVGTLVILKICDVTIGVRVTKEQEMRGPGSQHARRRRIYLRSVSRRELW